VAVAVDPSLPYDRAIAMGAAEYAREQGDWRLDVEQEHEWLLPDFDATRSIPSVATDNERITCLAAEHLLARALEHFGFYGLPSSPTTVWSDARCEAFSRRLADADRTCLRLVARHEANRWSLLQHELTQWLKALPKPVGIMACDDARARHGPR